MKNLYLGTNPSNAPTFLINGLDVCLKDSPRPVHAYVWLDQSNTDVLHAVGPHVAERFGADVTDWADVDVPDTKRMSGWSTRTRCRLGPLENGR